MAVQSTPLRLSSTPHIFTKLLKPVVSCLRRLGIQFILYLDDMLIMAQARDEVMSHLAIAMEPLCTLGFIVNMKKSVFAPARSIEFLGLILDSSTMSIELPQEKLVTHCKTANQLLCQREASLQDLAQILEMIVAAHAAILPAPLHYQHWRGQSQQSPCTTQTMSQ